MALDQRHFNPNPASLALGQLAGQCAREIDLARGVIHRPADINSVRTGSLGAEADAEQEG